MRYTATYVLEGGRGGGRDQWSNVKDTSTVTMSDWHEQHMSEMHHCRWGCVPVS